MKATAPMPPVRRPASFRRLRALLALLAGMWILYSSPCASAQGDLRICFYNVENLFDTADDPLTQDDEFTPSGARRWTPRRLRQ